MRKSAGIVFIKNEKILLGHPTNSPWNGTYSPPKGGIEKDETIEESAVRESFEEVGLKYDVEKLKSKETFIVDYKNAKGKRYKNVIFFIVYIDDNEWLDINNNCVDDILDKNQLQLEEIDWAGFLTKEEAEVKIFWRFKELLNFIKK